MCKRGIYVPGSIVSNTSPITASHSKPFLLSPPQLGVDFSMTCFRSQGSTAVLTQKFRESAPDKTCCVVFLVLRQPWRSFGAGPVAIRSAPPAPVVLSPLYTGEQAAYIYNRGAVISA